MSYFATRRTGDIERRLAGVRQVRQFLVAERRRGADRGGPARRRARLMFVYSWLLDARLPRRWCPLYVLLMRYSATRLRPMFDSLEEAFGRYASQQIDAIRGIETVKALAAEDGFRGRCSTASPGSPTACSARSS